MNRYEFASFNINGKTPLEKESLKRSANSDETLINNLRILAGTLFEPIAFQGLEDTRQYYIFNYNSIRGVEKKEFILIGGSKSWKLS